jgi:hypothetical protein
MIPQLNVEVIREELEAIRNRRLAVFLNKCGAPAFRAPREACAYR